MRPDTVDSAHTHTHTHTRVCQLETSCARTMTNGPLAAHEKAAGLEGGGQGRGGGCGHSAQGDDSLEEARHVGESCGSFREVGEGYSWSGCLVAFVFFLK